MQACYYKMEVQAVKSQGEQLCKAIEEGQVHMQAQQQELEQLKSKHAEQLEKLESELTAVKREWERVSMLEADIKAQELSAAVRAATEATEQRMRDEESTKHKDLLSQVLVIIKFFLSVYFLRSNAPSIRTMRPLLNIGRILSGTQELFTAVWCADSPAAAGVGTGPSRATPRPGWCQSWYTTGTVSLTTNTCTMSC